MGGSSSGGVLHPDADSLQHRYDFDIFRYKVHPTAAGSAMAVARDSVLKRVGFSSRVPSEFWGQGAFESAFKK